MLESSAKREGGEVGWSRGSLSDEDFDRAALSLRPSWEIGINAAPSADSLAPPRVEVLTTPFDPGKPASAVVIEAAAPETRGSIAPPVSKPVWGEGEEGWGGSRKGLKLFQWQSGPQPTPEGSSQFPPTFPAEF